MGNFLNSFLEFLEEQCSLPMTEKIPSSVKFGSRPRIFLIRSNSSGVRPCFATSSGVTFGSVVGSTRVIDNARYRMCPAAQRGFFLKKLEYCNCHSSLNLYRKKG